MACRNVYDGCIKYLLRNLSVIEFGQFDSEVLYNDTQPKYKIAHIIHKIAHRTHLNKCKGDRVIALKRQISLW